LVQDYVCFGGCRTVGRLSQDAALNFRRVSLRDLTFQRSRDQNIARCDQELRITDGLRLGEAHHRPLALDLLV
jgi:hypothetical protein